MYCPCRGWKGTPICKGISPPPHQKWHLVAGSGTAGDVPLRPDIWLQNLELQGMAPLDLTSGGKIWNYRGCPHHTWHLVAKSGTTGDSPPPPCKQTDWKQNLPSHYCVWAVIRIDKNKQIYYPGFPYFWTYKNSRIFPGIFSKIPGIFYYFNMTTKVDWI